MFARRLLDPIRRHPRSEAGNPPLAIISIHVFILGIIGMSTLIQFIVAPPALGVPTQIVTDVILFHDFYMTILCDSWQTRGALTMYYQIPSDRMYNGNGYDPGYPRAAELTTDATIVPGPRTTGWEKRVVRERDKHGGLVWNDDDEEEEEVHGGLYYDPAAPPSQYYVLPVMYVPSEGEVQEVYTLERPVAYGTEHYQNQFFTDTRTLNTKGTDGRCNKVLAESLALLCETFE